MRCQANQASDLTPFRAVSNAEGIFIHYVYGSKNSRSIKSKLKLIRWHSYCTKAQKRHINEKNNQIFARINFKR